MAGMHEQPAVEQTFQGGSLGLIRNWMTDRRETKGVTAEIAQLEAEIAALEQRLEEAINFEVRSRIYAVPFSHEEKLWR